MKVAKKKLFLVKREVRAFSMALAIHARGVIYEITEVEEKYKPEKEKMIGFKK